MNDLTRSEAVARSANVPDYHYTSSSDESVMRLLIGSAVILGLWQLVNLVIFRCRLHSASTCRSLHQANWTLRCATQTHLGDCAGDLAQSIARFIHGAVFAYRCWCSSRWETLVVAYLGTGQAIPVFAIAPVLMLWLGCGIASKVVMAAIIICFPWPLVVTTACKIHRLVILILLRPWVHRSNCCVISNCLLRCQHWRLAFVLLCWLLNWCGCRRVGRFSEEATGT